MSRKAPLSDGHRRWIALNIADDIAAECGTLPIVFAEKPSRSRCIAQAYATAYFLRKLGIADKMIQVCLDGYYFSEASARRKCKNSIKHQSNANTGAAKAMGGCRSSTETDHGEEIIRLIEADEACEAAHLQDLQRIFEPELSAFSDIDSKRLRDRRACSS